MNRNVDGMGSRIKILVALSKKPLIQKDLQDITGLSKTAVKHHLKALEKQNVIFIEKKEDVRGRPTIITLNKEKLEEQRDQYKKTLKEVEERMSNLPLTKTVLQIIKDNPNMDQKDLLNHEKIINHVHKFEVVSWLHKNDFIKESFKLTDKGNKFLEEKK